METFPSPGLLVAFAFVLGAILGSFLNVVIARVPFGQSVVWPPSHCMGCGRAIPARENIPILSWFVLRGRCSNCRARFSPRYALVELAFALVCAFAVARHGLSLPALREVALMGLLIPLTVMDLSWWILPHALTWPGIAVGLAIALGEGVDTFLAHLLAASVGVTGLMIVGFVGERVLKREALGGGDPWLMGMIGAFLGLRALFPVLLLASIQGSVIGVSMILARRRRGEQETTSRTEPVTPTPEPAGAEAGEPSPRPSEPEPPGAPAALAAETGTEEWKPDPTAVPFGPFLALGAAEVLYFTELPRVLLPF